MSSSGEAWLCSVFPEGGAVQGVAAGLQSPSVVSFEVLPSQSTDGHLVHVTELKQELGRCGAAAHQHPVVSNAPVLPLGVWTKITGDLHSHRGARSVILRVWG